MADRLTELRAGLDTVDTEIIGKLGERFALTREVGEYKKEHDLPPKDADREREMSIRLGQLAREYSVPEELVEAIYERITTRVRQDHAALKEASNA